MTIVALVTCAALPELDPDDQLLLAPLAAAGVVVEAAVWDDPSVAWDRFDLAVPGENRHQFSSAIPSKSNNSHRRTHD